MKKARGQGPWPDRSCGEKEGRTARCASMAARAALLRHWPGAVLMLTCSVRGPQGHPAGQGNGLAHTRERSSERLSQLPKFTLPASGEHG